MRNQPKYSFFKNWNYALKGFFEVFKNETAFKIECIIFMFLFIALFFWDISLIHKLLLCISIFVVIITELLNSSIERCVDLVTKEYHELAKHAKDAAAAAVMFSNILCFLLWVTIIYIYFNQ